MNFQKKKKGNLVNEKLVIIWNFFILLNILNIELLLKYKNIIILSKYY